MITDIKNRGFEKLNKELNNSLKQKNSLEVNINKLQHHLNLLNSQSKISERNNILISQETSKIEYLKEVSIFYKILENK